ncbi:hypothetical protein BKI52_25535 [marine bacterium AO1-C]|nr:hypothetical protein BKI52_25535 [marine bacterium AO1-C]
MTPLVAEAFEVEMLEKFVLQEANHLEQIHQYLNRFNVFEVLGIENDTSQHTHFLAWLVDPKASHKAGEHFLKLLVQKLYFLDTSTKIKYQLADLSQTQVQLNQQGVDILLVNDEVKLVICIKNFGESTTSDVDVLKENHQLIENKWSSDEYAKYYLYITTRHPWGELADDLSFQHLSYLHLKEMFQQLLSEQTLDAQVTFFIQSYIDSMEKNIRQEDEFIRLAQQIYQKHQQAIDFIIQHKPNYAQIFAEAKQYLLQEKSTDYKLLTPADAQVIRFLPQDVYPIFVRDQFASWEGTDAMFAIEVFFEADHIWAQFCFGGIWGFQDKPEEKARLQQIKTRYFDRMKTFASLQSGLVRQSKSTASYPAVAKFTLLKAVNDTPTREDLFEVFLDRFKRFEQEVIHHWKHEVLMNLP